MFVMWEERLKVYVPKSELSCKSRFCFRFRCRELLLMADLKQHAENRSSSASSQCAISLSGNAEGYNTIIERGATLSGGERPATFDAQAYSDAPILIF